MRAFGRREAEQRGGSSLDDTWTTETLRPDPQHRAQRERVCDPEVAPLVGLITIWYGGTRDLERYCAAMAMLTYPHVRSVFVSQGLSPRDRNRLSAAVPEATILDTHGNVGTAAAWNIGIQALLADGVDYVSIWNADIQPDPDAIAALVSVCEMDSTIGACQPVLLYSDARETVQMYGGTLDLRTGTIAHACAGANLDDTLPAHRDADYLDGGTMLLRAAALRTVGTFDERFFMYCEDVDMSLRLQAAGWRTVAARSARVWHYHRAEQGALPSPLEAFYDTRNRIYLTRKHCGQRAATALLIRTLLGQLRLVALYVRRGRPELARASVSGMAAGVLGRMGKRGWVAPRISQIG